MNGKKNKRAFRLLTGAVLSAFIVGLVVVWPYHAARVLFLLDPRYLTQRTVETLWLAVLWLSAEKFFYRLVIYKMDGRKKYADLTTEVGFRHGKKPRPFNLRWNITSGTLFFTATQLRIFFSGEKPQSVLSSFFQDERYVPPSFSEYFSGGLVAAQNAEIGGKRYAYLLLGIGLFLAAVVSLTMWRRFVEQKPRRSYFGLFRRALRPTATKFRRLAETGSFLVFLMERVALELLLFICAFFNWTMYCCCYAPISRFLTLRALSWKLVLPIVFAAFFCFVIRDLTEYQKEMRQSRSGG
ncbi:MAG: hypothetical protein ACI4QC_09865 [Thermoguttaceae bacterium]